MLWFLKCSTNKHHINNYDEYSQGNVVNTNLKSITTYIILRLPAMKTVRYKTILIVELASSTTKTIITTKTTTALTLTTNDHPSVDTSSFFSSLALPSSIVSRSDHFSLDSFFKYHFKMGHF